MEIRFAPKGEKTRLALAMAQEAWLRQIVLNGLIKTKEELECHRK